MVDLSANSSTRRSILALVMLAILLAMTGAAWLLVRVGQRRAATGAEIIQLIRSKGLAHWWSDQLFEQWHLATVDSRALGWRFEIRASIDGGYRGATVQSLRAVQQQVVEQWQLDTTLAQTTYTGLSLTPAEQSKTTIKVENDQITVDQFVKEQHAAAPRPPNFLPDGSLNAVLRVVAERQADAHFAVISDEHSVVGSAIEFAHVRVRYIGKEGAGEQALSRVEYSTSTFGHVKQDFLLDKTGRPVRMEMRLKDGTISWLAATPQEVAKQFPEAQGAVEGSLEDWVPGRERGLWRRLFGRVRV